MDQGSFRLTLSSGEQEVKVGKKDYRPKNSCMHCGIIDATVQIVDWGLELCQDCKERENGKD